MSFTRNPKYYDVDKNTKTKTLGYKSIEKQYIQAKNIVESANGNYNRLQKEMLQTIVDNIVYTANHSKFKPNSKTRQYYRLIDWCYNVFKPIPGIDASKIKSLML